MLERMWHMNTKGLNQSDERLTPMVPEPIELEMLGTELTLCFQDIKDPCEIRTCYGDICKIVNTLRDYSRLLLEACEEWDLQGYHRAIYELQAEKLKKISMKFQAGIGYDYDKAVEKCRKDQSKRSRNEDVGGEAMMMAYLKAQRAAETAENQDTPVGKESGAET